MFTQRMSPRGPGRRAAASPRLRAALPLALALGGCKQDNSLVKLDGDDVFFQLEAGEVDVLLVVDNSGSMQPYQDQLSTNFEEFLTYFEEGNVDYQIGVVTTSVQPSVPFGDCSQADVDAIPPAGQLAGGTWITPDSADGDALFQELVAVGTCGSGFEMGLESAYLAVSDPLASGENAGFLREDAYLSIIFVSDEQDASPMSVNEYINGFRNVKGQRSREIFNASALVVTAVDDCSANQVNAGANPGTRYLDVADQTDGVIGNICADDFGQIVTELSLTSSRLTDTFFLSDSPEPASLIVGIDGEEVPCDAGRWVYDKVEDGGAEVPAIVFDRAQLPPPNSKITVQYNIGTGDPAEFCPGGA